MGIELQCDEHQMVDLILNMVLSLLVNIPKSFSTWEDSVEIRNQGKILLSQESGTEVN